MNEQPKDGAHARDVFFELHAGLPRQAPGSATSTRKALELCTELAPAPAILDIGCGPGAQTLDLIEAFGEELEEPVRAIDLHAPFLEELKARAEDAGVADKVIAEVQDMTALPYEPASFDLLWAEGSIYSMGIAEALAAWRPLLREGGYLAFSDMLWLSPKPSPAARAYFEIEYPAMSRPNDVEAQIEAADGFDFAGGFAQLPEDWEAYYDPLFEKLPGMHAKYAEDPVALEVIRAALIEIEMRKRYGDEYAYGFFVVQAV